MTAPTIREITDAEAAERLANDLLDPQRSRPIVVLSTPMGSAARNIPDGTRSDAELVCDTVCTFADVAILVTGGVSRRLEDLLPVKWHVFGGAARSYPTALLKEPDIRRSPLRDRQRSGSAIQDLIADAMRHAREAGAFERPPTGSRYTTGTVRGHIADRAMIALDDGGFATAWGEAVAPGVPVDWLLRRNDTIRGTVDPTTGHLHPELTAADLPSFLKAYPHGAVTLALVTDVTENRATLLLRPGLSSEIRTTDVSSNPRDTLDLLLSPGEVVAVRVIHLSTGELHLRLSDVDEDEPVLPAPAIVAGGSPWLELGRHQVEEHHETWAGVTNDEVLAETETPSGLVPQQDPKAELPPQVDRAAAPAVDAAPDAPGAFPRPRPGLHPARTDPPTQPVDINSSSPDANASRRTALTDTQLALVRAQNQIRALEERLTDLGADDSAISRLRLDVRIMEQRWQEAEQELRAARSQLESARELEIRGKEALRLTRRTTASQETPEDRRAHWQSAEEWVRHEILRAWVERVPASDKAQNPLPEYLVGPRFVDSLATLTGDQFSKAMKAIVHVLTDRARDLGGRELHPLRTGDGGNDADQFRQNGQRCWRVAIERDVPSARRLHYWSGAGLPNELSRVVLHDDMEP